MNEHENPKRRMGGGMWRYGLPVLLLVSAVLAARVLIASRPEAARRKPPDVAVPVEVMHFPRTNHVVQIEAMGNVRPARQVALRAQVAGRVVRRHPALEAGGRLAAGELLVEIEREDYEAALKDAELLLAQARLAEALELQRQALAESEWDPGQDGEEGKAGREVALRRPHVEAARRAVVSAQAGVERASRNLARTRIQAPFEAVVLKAYVEEGTVLAPQSLVAELAGTTRFHVYAALPASSLVWLDLDEDGFPASGGGVRVSVRSDARETLHWQGRLVRVLSELTPQGLMAQVLVAVEHPLRGEGAPLLLGTYARCEIPGRRLEGVIAVPRRYIRDEGVIWLADPDDRLEFRSPEFLWMGPEAGFVVDGLAPEDRIVVTALPSAVPGMKLSILNDEMGP